MSLSMRSSLSLAVAGFSLLLLTQIPSAAQVVPLASGLNLAATDTTAAYTGTNGDKFVTYTLTTGNNTLTFTDATMLQRLDQGSGWAGDFTPGTRVLTNQELGPVTLAFSNPINELGFLIDPGQAGALTYSLEAFEGSVSLGSISVAAKQTGSGANTTAFLGLRDLDGNGITQVRITEDTTGLNFFAIGTVTYGSAFVPVPEPGSMALLAGFGLTGICFLARRRKNAR